MYLKRIGSLEWIKVLKNNCIPEQIPKIFKGKQIYSTHSNLTSQCLASNRNYQGCKQGEISLNKKRPKSSTDNRIGRQGLQIAIINIFNIVKKKKKKQPSPGWCGSVDWVPPINQRVAGSIPSRGTCLGCPHLGVHKRQPHSLKINK